MRIWPASRSGRRVNRAGEPVRGRAVEVSCFACNRQLAALGGSPWRRAYAMLGTLLDRLRARPATGASWASVDTLRRFFSRRASCLRCRSFSAACSSSCRRLACSATMSWNSLAWLNMSPVSSLAASCQAARLNSERFFGAGTWGASSAIVARNSQQDGVEKAAAVVRRGGVRVHRACGAPTQRAVTLFAVTSEARAEHHQLQPHLSLFQLLAYTAVQDTSLNLLPCLPTVKARLPALLVIRGTPAAS
jgi:hypothetical protein